MKKAEIDSQYVVTYRPKSGVALKSSEEIRRLEVVSRRVGLYVRPRRSYVVTVPSKLDENNVTHSLRRMSYVQKDIGAQIT